MVMGLQVMQLKVVKVVVVLIMVMKHLVVPVEMVDNLEIRQIMVAVDQAVKDQHIQVVQQVHPELQ